MNNKKKSLLGAGALTALATVALVSCGGSKASTYTITLDVNDATATIEADESYKVKTAEELLTALANVAPVKSGYTFEGWYLDEDCTIKLTSTTDLKNATKSADGTIVLYAAYTKNTYTVKFDYKGNAATAGAGSTTETKVDYNGVVTTSPKPTTAAKDSLGHEMTFTGWYSDSACTTAVNFAETKITGNTTFYAGWTITKIESEADFIAYVNQNDANVNAYLAADITMTQAFERPASKDDALSSNGTDQTNKLTAKLYGDNHKITNLTINAALKSSGLFGKLSGTVQDLTFEGATITSSGARSALIAGTLENGATITDVKFDGVELTNTASDGYAAFIGAEVKEANATINIDGVTVKNSTLTGVKYNGGLIASIATACANINVTDCLIDMDITQTGQDAGFILGYVDKAKGYDSVLTIDGVVASGTITATKNIGAFVGDIKNSAGKEFTINVKNSAVIGFRETATASDTSPSTLSTFVGQNYATLNIENSYYQEYGSTIILVDSVSTESRKQGEAVSLATLATKTLSSNITLTYTEATFTLKASLNGVEIEAVDPTIVDTSNYGKTLSKEGSAVTINSETGKFVITGSIPYYEKVVAGAAGNGILVNLGVPTDNNVEITDFEGMYVASGLTNSTINAVDHTVSGYVIFDETDLTAWAALENGQYYDKTITVVWFSNSTQVATPMTYTLAFRKGYTTFQNAIDNGAISLSATDANADLTAAVDSTDNTILNVTAGQIDFVTDGNYVRVSIAKPTNLTSTVSLDTITVSGATKISYADNAVIVKVKVVKKGATNFTVTWNSAMDPDAYTIDVANDVTIEEGAVSYNETFDATTLTNASADKEKITQAELGSFFTLIGSGDKRSATSGGSVTSVEFKDAGLQFTVTDTVIVTAEVASTGGTNMSLVALYKEGVTTAVAAETVARDTNDVITQTNNVIDVFGTYKKTTITYELEKGTYTLKGIQGTSTGSGTYTYKDSSNNIVTKNTTSESVARGARFHTLTVVSKTTA